MQFRSSIDAGPLDDLYSCGATVYRLVTGELPNILFKPDETPDELHRHNLPPEAVALIALAMAVDPQQRFQSGKSFADALRQLGDCPTFVNGG